MPPFQIPLPTTSSPGANPQESAGRLINVCAEPIVEGGPSAVSRHRQPGFTKFSDSALTGYRGGLIVNSLSYETWLNNASTVDGAGGYANLGAFPGSRHVSIARNQNGAGANVIAVDPDNGAYNLSTGGAPALYNGGGVLPQPNSVCFQDSYFFFTIGDNRCFASGINALTQNANTFITVQKKADVTLLRGIAYSGNLWLFTTGHCEIWNDTAAAFPAFPYSFLLVVNYGLLQTNAIAGFETGFDQLLWVSQDYGVYWAKDGNQQPTKVSPPDLDRLVQKAFTAGQQLVAGCYMFGGKKFWTLTCSDWTWEFNLNTTRWNERDSLVNGLYKRWRFDGGHPAFNQWLGGDSASGKILYIDVNNFTDDGAPMRARVESGPVTKFPMSNRIARMDANFVLGVGVSVGSYLMTVSNAISGTGGVIRLTVDNASRAHNGDVVRVLGVTGTLEANGTWVIVVIDTTHIELVGSIFTNTYLTGGTALDITSAPTAVHPVVAISASQDGGQTWDNPSIRQLGALGKSERIRVSVKNRGIAPPLGMRWRFDVTDEVFFGLLSATQSSNPRDVGG